MPSSSLLLLCFCFCFSHRLSNLSPLLPTSQNYNLNAQIFFSCENCAVFFSRRQKRDGGVSLLTVQSMTLMRLTDFLKGWGRIFLKINILFFFLWRFWCSLFVFIGYFENFVLTYTGVEGAWTFGVYGEQKERQTLQSYFLGAHAFF